MKTTLISAFGAGLLGIALMSSAEDFIEFETPEFQGSTHPAIVVRVSERLIPKSDIEIILEGFVSEIANGTTYKAGETIQIGFMVNEFGELDDNRLILQEPDMSSFPIHFVPKMDNTFKFLRQQKDLVESLIKKTDLEFPNIGEALVVHKDYKVSRDILLERLAPEGRQSGWWVVAGGDPDTENYSLISIYQFALDRPDLLKYLALPPGFRVFDKTGEPIQVFYEEKNMEIDEDSFLNKLNQSRANEG